MKKYVKGAISSSGIVGNITPIDAYDAMHDLLDEIGMHFIDNSIGMGFNAGWYGNDLITWSHEEDAICYYKGAKLQEEHWIRLLTDEDYEEQVWRNVRDGDDEYPYFTDYDKMVKFSDINGFLSWFE